MRLSVAVIATASAIAFSTQFASAADMPTKAPIAPAVVAPALTNWSGFYIGGNLGAAWAKSDFETSGTNAGSLAAANLSAILATGTGSASDTKLTGGVQAGYNFQWDKIVLGIESDFNWLNIGNNRNAAITVPFSVPPTFTTTDSLSANWLFTLRPRLGLTVNSLLFYVTGGLALTEISQSHTLTISSGVATPEVVSVKKTKSGWVVGGGTEWAFASHWSAKVEYLHADFGNIDSNGIFGATGLVFPQPLNHTADLKVDLARAGLNYRF